MRQKIKKKLRFRSKIYERNYQKNEKCKKIVHTERGSCYTPQETEKNPPKVLSD